MPFLADLLAIPSRIREVHVMAEQTTAALAELQSAIDEVAAEIEALAANDNLDAETAEAILAAATRLRGLREDEPAEEPPA